MLVGDVFEGGLFERESMYVWRGQVRECGARVSLFGGQEQGTSQQPVHRKNETQR